MTKGEWQAVEKGLAFPGASRTIICDEYSLTLRVERLDQLKNAIVTYVNRELKGKWLLTDCEERRRFLCEDKHFVFKAKERVRMKAAIKKWGKGFAEEYKLFPNQTISSYRLYWTSFRALKKHLIKNNKIIELSKSCPEELKITRAGGEDQAAQPGSTG